MTPRTLPLLVLLALSGCAGGPPTSHPAPETTVAVPATPPTAAPLAAPPTVAEQRTAAASTLAVERQWLAAWFKGTPVVIAQRPNGAVTVDVPREFCFDAGKDAVKPALAAVLDKLAQSMRRTSIAELHLIAAPGDSGAGAGAPLALRRATRVYDFLRGRGVPEARLAKPSANGGTAVQLRIEATPPA
ncbi:MAG: hypothetical protein ABI745_12940 [Caldimonas sp.]